jgi:hypothetical protein
MSSFSLSSRPLRAQILLLLTYQYDYFDARACQEPPSSDASRLCIPLRLCRSATLPVSSEMVDWIIWLEVQKVAFTRHLHLPHGRASSSLQPQAPPPADLSSRLPPLPILHHHLPHLPDRFRTELQPSSAPSPASPELLEEWRAGWNVQ